VATVNRASAAWAGVLAAAVLVLGSVPSQAQDADRPTIQNRFGEKAGSLYAHAALMTQIRNDYYDSIGFGADAGYYPGESLGLEVRWLYLLSSLNPAAADVKNRTGLTPDARPQHMMMTVGARYSIGYGKMLVGRERIVHFDPQIVTHGGIALAEKRVLPTLETGLSLLTHFKWGLQAKVDLLAAFQLEDRDRGWVPSFGFVPVLGVGWNGRLEETETTDPNEGGDT